jgi:hypothetical protein
MKVARFLLVPALLLALAGATHAQAPQGPVQLDPGPMMPGPTSHGSMGGEYCPPDMAGGPVYSDCCPDEGFQGILRKRTSRGYVKLDAVMLHRNDATNRTLFNLGSVAAGTPILTAGQPDFGFETLPRVTAGFVLMNDIALEATVWYKDDFDGIRDATSTTVPGPLNAVFGAPLITTYPAGSAFSDTNLVNVRAATGIHSYEFNLVETSHAINFIAGFRYMEIRDRLTIIATDTSLPAPLGTGTAVFGTYNHMMGTQLGLTSKVTRSLFTLDSAIKVGAYINDSQTAMFVRDITAPILRQTKFGGQNEAFSADFNVNLTCQVSAAMAIRLGYQCMFINQVALAADQIVPPPNANLTGLTQNARGDLFLHGPSAGFEFRW